jgi:4-hydroxybenzoate polyprenyltransferase/phosphoserine phosphatase
LQGVFLSLFPVVVDLDGTLIFTDMLHESALKVAREQPLDALRVPFWLARGKAVLKRELASRCEIDATHLPYNQDLLVWLQEQRRQGRRLVLCTASDVALANAVAEHLGIFDEVMASEGVLNLAGEHKAEALEHRFGLRGFDYAGNSSTDLAVWRRARRAIVVNGAASLAGRAAVECEVEHVLPSAPAGLKTWSKVLRVHQWLKNLLLFVPMLAAHAWEDAANWSALLLAFVAFSLCASSVYIANDLLDLDSDRQHPRKRRRPFASGAVPAWRGVLLAPFLLAASLLIASAVNPAFAACLLFYFVLTCVYSFGLKRLLLVDCLTLAVLYTLRIIAGAAAVASPLSFWLLAFSVFLFLSLAFVKRYAEMLVQLQSGKQKVHGRGYLTSDAPLVQMLGVTSAYASVVVLALYLNSDAVRELYATPELLWGVVPVMLFWISWVWLQAHRGNMHDDPLVFAVKDRASLCAGLLFSIVLGSGMLVWPW